MKILNNILFGVLFLAVVGCSDDNPVNTGNGNNNDGSEGTNYNPALSFEFKGMTYTMSSSDNTAGGKLYIFAMDQNGNPLLDFAVPVEDGKTASNIPFDYVDASGKAKGIFYVDGDQWGLKGSGISVTKYSDNRVSGNFSGKAYKLDNSGSTTQVVDSAQLTNGVFTDLEIK
jgi:hypothetical protein